MSEEIEQVKVFCRLKPSFDPNEETCVFYENKNHIEYLRTVPPIDARRNAKEATHMFDRIFNNTQSQNEIYEDVAYPLVLDLIEGKNSLLFTYGVTGSGKTFTMQGSNNEPGIVPRTLKSLFRRINLVPRYRVQSDLRNGFKLCSAIDALTQVAINRNKYSRRSGDATSVAYLKDIEDVEDVEDDFSAKVDNCTVFISLVEIYGKQITDLLAPKNDIKTITIKEDGKRNKYLHNVCELEVQTAEEAFCLYLKGQKTRKVEATKLNNESSRSHMVFNIRLVRLDSALTCDDDNTRDMGHMWTSQLSLVDLAGSERNQRTEAAGMRLKEAGNINNSLLVLRKCMELLRDKSTTEKPDYRSNELTHLFKTTLEGGSALRMIVCIQSTASEYNETMQVLKFADNSQEISMPVQKINEPVKITKPFSESTTNLSHDKQIERLNEIFNFVYRRRMLDPNDVGNDVSDIDCILELTEKSNETLQYVTEILNTMVDACAENQEQLDVAVSKLNRERLSNSRQKKQLTEFESRVAELELELFNLRKSRSKQDEKIKSLEEQLKKKSDEVKTYQIQLQSKQIHDDSVRLNQPVSVKAMAKKIENKMETNSKKCATKIHPPVITAARKGFYNAQYTKPNNKENWIKHEETNEIPAGTLNQVKLKPARKSKNPDIDVLKKGDKYLLQHQTVNSESELKTAYHKGNIIPTVSGGVAMVYNEVETVKQRGVGHKKRRSSVSTDFDAKRCKEDEYGDGDSEY